MRERAQTNGNDDSAVQQMAGKDSQLERLCTCANTHSTLRKIHILYIKRTDTTDAKLLQTDTAKLRTKSHGERILDAAKPRRAHQSQIGSIIVLLFGRHSVVVTVAVASYYPTSLSVSLKQKVCAVQYRSSTTTTTRIFVVVAAGSFFISYLCTGLDVTRFSSRTHSWNNFPFIVPALASIVHHHHLHIGVGQRLNLDQHQLWLEVALLSLARLALADPLFIGLST
jgi:hypothetical protein